MLRGLKKKATNVMNKNKPSRFIFVSAECEMRGDTGSQMVAPSEFKQHACASVNQISQVDGIIEELDDNSLLHQNSTGSKGVSAAPEQYSSSQDSRS